MTSASGSAGAAAGALRSIEAGIRCRACERCDDTGQHAEGIRNPSVLGQRRCCGSTWIVLHREDDEFAAESQPGTEQQDLLIKRLGVGASGAGSRVAAECVGREQRIAWSGGPRSERGLSFLNVW